MPRPRKASYGDDKPPYSYVALCTMAINSSPTKMMTLSAIYKYIMEKFLFYRKSNLRWQNSLRHNLSFNDCFVKISKGNDQGGSSSKGSYWTLHQSSSQMFQEGSYLRRKRRFHKSKNPGPDEEMNSDRNQRVNSTTIDNALSGERTKLDDNESRSVYTEKDEYLRSGPSHYTRFTIDSILDNNKKDNCNTTATLSDASSSDGKVHFNHNVDHLDKKNFLTMDNEISDNFKRTTRTAQDFPELCKSSFCEVKS